MDWTALSALFPADRQLSDRTNRLLALGRVRDQTLYDVLAHPFSTEKSPSGEYVALNERRPSVRTSLCRVVVDDAVSLLFSEGHWPTIVCTNETTAQSLAALVKETSLNQVMLNAATTGSTGSVAIVMRVLSGRVFLDVLDSAFLTPVWKPNAPDKLARITRRYKVKGSGLRDIGYTIADDDLAKFFWFESEWDENSETWFVPRPVDSTAPRAVDPLRSVQHGLGFVPVVWIKNLPGGVSPDGECTFERAIDVMIESDYLLSQAGRALKYSSDPKVVLKFEGDGPAITGGSAQALVLPAGGDAKMLEINGEAARTVIEHTRELRAIALEAIHGNRAHADKLSAAQSGRAIEMLYAGLIWLADRLRITYGEVGLTGLLRMVCAASQAIEGGIEVGGERVVLDPTGLELRWPPWFPATPQDALVTAQGVVTAYAGGVISLETSVARMASVLGVDDVRAELALVQAATAKKEQQAADAAAAAAQAVRQAANAGPSDTRHETA